MATGSGTARDKRRHGQYFTTTNPFAHPAFRAWAGRAGLPAAPVLEPFAGADNLVRMLRELDLIGASASFDLVPRDPAVVFRDTLADFPSGFDVVVTNPPYLARNSASRRGLPFPECAHDDLYKHALGICLEHCRFVAAIIPESFLQSGLFRDRCTAVVSLTCPMFEDTEHPVCLALFEPRAADMDVWRGDERLGTIDALARHLPREESAARFVFNDPAGPVGLRAVDGTKGPSIAFCAGEEIPSGSVKPTSRSLTRIGVSGVAPDDLPALIARANARLADLRAATGDVFLTSFKGLRSDGFYRRRLDFALARALLHAAAADSSDA